MYQHLFSLNDDNLLDANNTSLSSSTVSTVSTTDISPQISGSIIEDSDSDDQTDEPEYSFGKYRVNLREFEKAYDKPIFSRDVLQKMAQLCDQALTRDNGILSLSHPDILGNDRVVWKAPEGDENAVMIKYATRVDLNEDFQTKMSWKTLPEAEYKVPYQSTEMVELVHEYNRPAVKTPHNEWIPLPFVLENFEIAICKIHTNQDAMTMRSRIFDRTKELWIKSEARTALEKKFHFTSQGSVRIGKIVCLGLGSLFDPDMSCEGILQHLAAFTIAIKLHSCYKTVEPDCPPIKIVAQDPCYSEADRILLRSIGEITFVSDPQAFLEIDEHTLVLTFCLPFAVPLMQILADMFEPGKGPAALLCDTLSLDPERSLYRYRRRESPAVCRMLSPENYRSCGFKGWDMDEDLEDYVYPDGTMKKYWLRQMTLYFRMTENTKQVLHAAKSETLGG